MEGNGGKGSRASARERRKKRRRRRRRRKRDDKIESSVKFRRKHVGPATFESARKSLERVDGKEYFFESAASIGTRGNVYPTVRNARAPLRSLSRQDSRLNDDWISQRRFSEFRRRGRRGGRRPALYGVSGKSSTAENSEWNIPSDR